MKTVTKEEFEYFIKTYPNKLKTDVFAAGEPPCVTFNDFMRAPYWPDSVVATKTGNTRLPSLGFFPSWGKP